VKVNTLTYYGISTLVNFLIKLTFLTVGIHYLIIHPGYQTDNRGARNSIDFDIV